MENIPQQPMAPLKEPKKSWFSLYHTGITAAVSLAVIIIAIAIAWVTVPKSKIEPPLTQSGEVTFGCQDLLPTEEFERITKLSITNYSSLGLLEENKTQSGLLDCYYGLMAGVEGVSFTVSWSIDSEVSAEQGFEFKAFLGDEDKAGNPVTYSELFGTGLGSRVFKPSKVESGYLVLSSNRKYFFSSTNLIPSKDTAGTIDFNVMMEIDKVIDSNLNKY